MNNSKLSPVTAVEVLSAAPDWNDADYGPHLRLSDDKMFLCTGFEDTEDYAATFTPSENGEWSARGITLVNKEVWSDEVNPVWSEEIITNRSGMLAFFLEVANDEEVEPAYDVFCAIADHLHVLRTHVRNRELLLKVPSLSLTSAGGMCPFQAEGYLDEMPFYFRYRGGSASLRVGGEDVIGLPLYSAGEYLGSDEDEDPYMGTKEFHDAFVFLLGRLERAPMNWRFEGKRVTAVYPRDVIGEDTFAYSWGFTQEEAFTRITSLDVSWTAGMGLSPISVSVDERIYPEYDPIFVVVNN